MTPKKIKKLHKSHEESADVVLRLPIGIKSLRGGRWAFYEFDQCVAQWNEDDVPHLGACLKIFFNTLASGLPYFGYATLAEKNRVARASFGGTKGARSRANANKMRPLLENHIRAYLKKHPGEPLDRETAANWAETHDYTVEHVRLVFRTLKKDPKAARNM